MNKFKKKYIINKIIFILLCVYATADSFAAGSWQTLPDFGLSERSEVQISVGDGQVFLFGGVGPNLSGKSAFQVEAYNDGVLYNSKTNSWKPLPPAPITKGIANANSLWSGQEFVTLGGYYWSGPHGCKGPGRSHAGGGCYSRHYSTESAFFDPKLFTWRKYPYSSHIEPKALHFDENTNQLLLMVQGDSRLPYYSSDMMISMGNLSSFQYQFSADVSLKEIGKLAEYASAWHSARREFIIWGGRRYDSRLGYRSGFIYSANSDSWRRMPAPPSGFLGRFDMAHALIGDKLIVWGGRTDASRRHNLSDGAMFDLVTNTWTLISPAPIEARDNPSFASNGKQLFIGFGSLVSEDLLKARESTADFERVDRLRLNGRHWYPAPESADAAIFNPNNNTWEKLPDPPLSAPRSFPAVTWHEDKIYFWGGRGSGLANDGRYFNDGAVYTINHKKVAQ